MNHQPTPFYPVRNYWNYRFSNNSKWKDSSGAIVTITDVKLYTEEHSELLSDYSVVYSDSKGNIYEKDAWNFQVRYSYFE